MENYVMDPGKKPESKEHDSSRCPVCSRLAADFTTTSDTLEWLEEHGKAGIEFRISGNPGEGVTEVARRTN